MWLWLERCCEGSHLPLRLAPSRVDWGHRRRVDSWKNRTSGRYAVFIAKPLHNCGIQQTQLHDWLPSHRNRN